MSFCGFESGLERTDVVGENGQGEVTVCMLEAGKMLFVDVSATVTETSSTVPAGIEVTRYYLLYLSVERLLNSQHENESGM